MAVEVKVAPDNQLELKSVFIEDRRVNSQYFNLTELPDTFTGGKNAFLIAGTDYLEPDTEVLVQIRDASGRIVYTESSDGSPEYYEGLSKVVAVYVYPTDSVEQAIDSTAFGPCTIIILGQLKFYDNNGSKTEVPEIFKGKFNIRYVGQANINPNLANTTRVRFFRRPQVRITELLKPIFNVSGSAITASAIISSYANIKLSRLETFAGDVKRVKVYRSSEGTVSDFELIQDIQIESRELLQTFEATGSVVTDTGFFNVEVLSNFWNTGSLSVSLDTTQFSGSTAVRLNGSGDFIYSPPLDLGDITVYELSLDGFYTGSSQSNLEVYISGSQNGNVKVATINGLFPTFNFTNYTTQFSLPKSEPTASLYFKQTQGTWFLKDISLRASSETVFSPNEVSFVLSMPTNISNETFNFNFEFFDVNNNFIPVAVTASQTFTGGNDSIGNLADTITAISGGLITFSGSFFEDVFSGSNSLSGSLTSSISKSVSELSQSVSQSVSRSIETSKSASLANLQILADGGFSGTFIDGTTVFAPVIGGTTGYISGKFTVGAPPNSIVLDATTSTRRIYIGTGAYNNSNTSIYLDSDGKFSLKDKLTFDGTNLSVNGSITITNPSTANNGGVVGSFSNGDALTGGSIAGVTISSTKIFIGTGTHGNANTGFYVDSSGKFSLKDKLVWDGTTLNIVGNLNVGSSVPSSAVSGLGSLATQNTVSTGQVTGLGGLATKSTVTNAELADNAVSEGKLEANAVTSGKISANAVIAGKIAANAVTADQIAAGSITAGKIVAGAITADRIAADTITATNISSLSFSGKSATFDNGTIGGWSMSSTELTGGSPAGGGNGSFTSSGIRLGSSGYISAKNFYIDSSGNAAFRGDITGASGTFSGNLSGANITGATGTFAGNLAGASLSGGSILVTSGGTIVFEPFGFSTYLEREAMFTPRIRLYSNAPNDSLSFDFLYSSAGLTTLGVDAIGNVKKVSSSRKYKKEIESLPLEDAKRILDLNIVSFKDKNTEIYNTPHAGLIAEEVDDLNYKDWVIYDNSGSVDGVYYQSIFSSMVKVVQDLNKRVEELEAKISGSL